MRIPSEEFRVLSARPPSGSANCVTRDQPAPVQVNRLETYAFVISIDVVDRFRWRRFDIGVRVWIERVHRQAIRATADLTTVARASHVAARADLSRRGRKVVAIITFTTDEGQQKSTGRIGAHELHSIPQ